MYTNVKINPKLKKVMGSAIFKALEDVPVATVEMRESLNKFEKSFPMFKGLNRTSPEFEALLDEFVIMLQDAVSYEDHEQLPDDFIDNYQFNLDALSFGYIVQNDFWKMTGEGAFTCDDKLKLVDGGNDNA